MAYTDLRDFIEALEKHGELKRISIEVDPVLEIAEFADRSVKSHGPAFLFEKPKGSRIPVLINAFASARRMELALEVDSVDAIAAARKQARARAWTWPWPSAPIRPPCTRRSCLFLRIWMRC